MLYAARNAYDGTEGNKEKKNAAYSDTIAYTDHGHFLALFLHPLSAEYRRAKEEGLRYSIIVSYAEEPEEGMKQESSSSFYVIEASVVHPDPTNLSSSSIITRRRLPDQEECHTLESAVEAIFKAFKCIISL